MKWIIKFFEWLFSGESVHAKFENRHREFVRTIDTQKAEKIFAEIDNDLIIKIDRATKDFMKAQLRHIPCQMVYYSKFEIKSTIDMTKLFLIKRNRIIDGGSVTLENGEQIHAGKWHENTKYIKLKGNVFND